MAEKRGKRTTWSFEETNDLINEMAKADIQKRLEGMVHNHRIWKEVSDALGGRHSAEKCHDKWTYLKRRYREIVKNNNSSGRGRQTFLFFDQMDCVLGHRPMSGVANHSHLDSSSLLESGSASEEEQEAEEEENGANADNTFSQDSSLASSVELEDDAEQRSSTSNPPVKRPSSKGAIKLKKGRGTPSRSSALENALASLVQLQDRMEEREDKRMKIAEEKEERMLKEERETDERRRRWEQEQEDRRAKEHQEFMLQMVQLLKQPAYPPNYSNQANGWSGPSYTSL